MRKLLKTKKGTLQNLFLKGVCASPFGGVKRFFLQFLLLADMLAW